MLLSLISHLGAGKAARLFEVTDEQNAFVRSLCMITRKPMMYIANVNEDALDNSALATRLQQFANNEGAQMVMVCAQIEAEIALLEDDERSEFLADLGLAEPGLNRVIRAGYELLNLQTFFTCGPKETRAWTVLKLSLIHI